MLPEGWAEQLARDGEGSPERRASSSRRSPRRATRVTVRTEPGDDGRGAAARSRRRRPRSSTSCATDVVRQLGAWGEEYEIASGEDVDLCFKVWVNDLDIVYDQRVLVDHVGKGSASRLDDWQGLWARNRRRFLDKWTGDGVVPRLETCDEDRFERNRAIARAVAGWMERYFTARDRPGAPAARWRRVVRRRASAARSAFGRRTSKVGRAVWRRARPHLPLRAARTMHGLGKRMQRTLVPPSVDQVRERESQDYRDDGVVDGESPSRG